MQRPDVVSRLNIGRVNPPDLLLAYNLNSLFQGRNIIAGQQRLDAGERLGGQIVNLQRE